MAAARATQAPTTPSAEKKMSETPPEDKSKPARRSTSKPKGKA